MTETNTADRLINDLHAVIRDAESLLTATAAQTGEKVEAARARAAESVQRARARLDEIEQHALAEAQKVVGQADDYVRGNPWQAVGVAAGIGLVLGLLIGRR